MNYRECPTCGEIETGWNCPWCDEWDSDDAEE